MSASQVNVGRPNAAALIRVLRLACWKTVGKDAERSRCRELEESYNQIKRRTLPPTSDRAGSEWLEAEKPHLAGRTYEIYEVAYRCHLKPVLGSLLLCDIDASKIASYQAKRKSEKASARTLNKELQVLRQVLKRYKLWANLQGDVKFEREHNNVGKALSQDDERCLLDACGSNALLKAVNSGRVLIAGGRGESVNATAELYDPQTKTFLRTGSMLTARYNTQQACSLMEKQQSRGV